MEDEPLLQFFKHEHLPQQLAYISKPFGELAAKLVVLIPRNAERTRAIESLLDAKDRAVRAMLYTP